VNSTSVSDCRKIELTPLKSVVGMTKILNVIEAHWIALTLLTLAVITVFSLWPESTAPMMPGTDKSHHLMAYAVLMFPAALRKPERWIWIGLFFSAYGGVIEFLQPFVNRNGEWLDMAASTIGVVCGLIAAELVKRFSQLFLKRFR